MPKISGSKGVSNRLAGLSGQKKVQFVGRALFAAGEEIKAHAARLITEGAVSGANHVASLPGHPPNEDTGHLRTGIIVEQPGPLRVLVASNARYSAALEYGTSKMAARPFMGPSARSKRKRVRELVGTAVTIATRKA